MRGSTIRRLVLAAAVVVAGVAGGTSALASPSGDGGKAFTRCLRSHGLPGFPGVAVSEDGLVNLTVKGERVDVLSATYGRAVAACESLLPKGAVLPGKPVAPSAPSLPS
ncbi:MAG: hypothetical protein HOY71_39675 [Nonomuraea sp.]|nr:hypothetical protein [Nonomuraea sp.]